MKLQLLSLIIYKTKYYILNKYKSRKIIIVIVALSKNFVKIF